MSASEQVIAILPVSLTDWGNSQAESFNNGGPAFGLVLLSANGEAPATHTACNVRVSPEVLAQIEQAATEKDGVQLFQGDNYTWEIVLQAVGLKVVLPTEEDILSG